MNDTNKNADLNQIDKPESSLSSDLVNKWLSEAKSGTQAFDNIYDLYFPKIYNYFLYRVGEQSTAEDLTSETFIKIISKFDTFKGNNEAFTAWIYRIASNLITDYYRLAKRKIQVYFMPNDDLANLTNQEPLAESIDEKIDKHSQLENIRQAINQLPLPEQELISLKYFEGLDNQTIAEILKVKPGTLNVRLHRTLEKLKNLFKGQKIYV